MKSRALFSLPQERELEEAVLEPPAEAQQDQGWPSGPQSEPAELKRAQGAAGSSFCLLTGCDAAFSTLPTIPISVWKREDKTLTLIVLLSFPVHTPPLQCGLVST